RKQSRQVTTNEKPCTSTTEHLITSQRETHRHTQRSLCWCGAPALRSQSRLSGRSGDTATFEKRTESVRALLSVDRAAMSQSICEANLEACCTLRGANLRASSTGRTAARRRTGTGSPSRLAVMYQEVAFLAGSTEHQFTTFRFNRVGEPAGGHLQEGRVLQASPVAAPVSAPSTRWRRDWPG
ncbi:hypothetical protein L3Q82_014789, partial [Scortum barcoo]